MAGIVPETTTEPAGTLPYVISPLQEADLVVIAGRPSMGKTSLAMNIAENAAVGAKLPVAVFSMEMPGQQLAMRMLASLGLIITMVMSIGVLPTWVGLRDTAIFFMGR